jgi:plastocyanin
MATQPVSVNSNFYDPASLTINVGDTVVWTWAGNMHSVTSDSGEWPNTGLQGAGFTFNHTFNNSGSFDYHCTHHPGMRGTIVVSDTPPEETKKPSY